MTIQRLKDDFKENGIQTECAHKGIGCGRGHGHGPGPGTGNSVLKMKIAWPPLFLLPIPDTKMLLASF